MENIATLKMQSFFTGLSPRLTRENLCIASTLIVPLVLLIFLPVESLLILTMLALFILTIAVFNMKKDRDYCRHSWETCRDLLEEETKKLQVGTVGTKKENKQMINCKKSTGTPDGFLTIYHLFIFFLCSHCSHLKFLCFLFKQVPASLPGMPTVISVLFHIENSNS